MQSLLGVDLFGTHGDDMKQVADRKEHQTQNRNERSEEALEINRARGENEDRRDDDQSARRDQLFRPRRRPPLRSAGLRKGVGGEAAPDGPGSRIERRAFCVCEPDVRGVPHCIRVQVGAGRAYRAAGLKSNSTKKIKKNYVYFGI